VKKPFKTSLWIAVLSFGIIAGFAATLKPQSVPLRQRSEYVTIRWDGRDNTHLIRPHGRVEHIGKELQHFRRPNRTDERSFYMNIAVNGLAKDGYEVVAMTKDEILMRRFTP
jgi:hypothetical protein